MVLENDILGSEIGSGFRELGAKSAQPPPPGMKLANYSSTVAGVETTYFLWKLSTLSQLQSSGDLVVLNSQR